VISPEPATYQRSLITACRQPVDQPVGQQDRRERSRLAAGTLPTSAAIPGKRPSASVRERRHQPIGIFERTQLFGLAGDAQIRHADFFGVAFPGDRLAKFVELGLVGDPDMYMKRFLKVGDAS